MKNRDIGTEILEGLRELKSNSSGRRTLVTQEIPIQYMVLVSEVLKDDDYPDGEVLFPISTIGPFKNVDIATSWAKSYLSEDEGFSWEPMEVLSPEAFLGVI